MCIGGPNDALVTVHNSENLDGLSKTEDYFSLTLCV